MHAFIVCGRSTAKKGFQKVNAQWIAESSQQHQTRSHQLPETLTTRERNWYERIPLTTSCIMLILRLEFHEDCPYTYKIPKRRAISTPEACFSKVPDVFNGRFPDVFRTFSGRFRTYLRWHNFLCVFKMKASRATKHCSYFYFYSIYNIWKDQLYRISRS